MQKRADHRNEKRTRISLIMLFLFLFVSISPALFKIQANDKQNSSTITSDSDHLIIDRQTLLSAQNTTINAYWINLSGMPLTNILTAYTIQGLANRNGPKLYIVDGNSDAYWKTVFQNYSINFTEISNITELITTFLPDIKGIIIYDDQISDSINMANMMSGLLDSIVADNTHAINMNTSMNLPILFNCTAVIQQNSLNTKYARYNWTYYEYKDSWNKTTLSMIPADSDWRIIVNNRDYITKHKLFAFPEINFGHNETGFFEEMREKELISLFQEILPRFQIGTRVIGFPYPTGGNEKEMVENLAANGHYMVPSGYISDASFHEALPKPDSLKQSHRKENYDYLHIQNKIYTTFVVSDGDNVAYDQSYFVDFYWKDPLRGTVPLAYTTSGQMADYYPYMLKHFYDTMTPNDYFVMAAGIGYTYPDKLDENSFKHFCEMTKDASERSDLDIYWLLGADRQRTLSLFAARTQATAIYSGFWGFSEGIREGYMSSTTLVVPISKGGLKNTTEIVEFIQSVKDDNLKRPVFLALYLDTWATINTGSIYKTIKDAMDSFNSEEVEILRIDEMAYLYTEYIKTKPFVGWDAVILWSVFTLVALGFALLIKETIKGGK